MDLWFEKLVVTFGVYVELGCLLFFMDGSIVSLGTQMLVALA